MTRHYALSKKSSKALCLLAILACVFALSLTLTSAFAASSNAGADDHMVMLADGTWAPLNEPHVCKVIAPSHGDALPEHPVNQAVAVSVIPSGADATVTDLGFTID